MISRSSAEAGGQGGAAGRALGFAPGLVRLAGGIVRLDGGRETQVRQRVLVRAADLGVVGQRGQALQRVVHLRRRAFEQAAAAGGEQRVAAEQQRRLGGAAFKIGDVAGGVAGHIDDLEVPAEHRDGVAVAQRQIRLGDGFAGRRPDRALQARTQRVDAADVIGVVVGH